ncbi:sperm acrosome membrane-associated protein 4-like [Heterodontus francisci]|uniref:sperm acrosome membrane-associated protein 4-like n=1 Tax=Heterodontus francisci TaxID=7792 RepID=UPI00355C71DF
MKYLLLLGCALVLCVSLGDCLMCYHCGLSSSRCITGARNCTGVNETCFYRVGKAGSVTIYSAGCIQPSGCKQNFQQTFAGISVSLTTNCCNRDLCNGSSHVKSSLLLSVVLAALWFIRFL